VQWWSRRDPPAPLGGQDGPDGTESVGEMSEAVRQGYPALGPLEFQNRAGGDMGARS